MPKYNRKSDLIDGLLKLTAVSGITLTTLVAPNAMKVFDKPLQKYLKSLDSERREREFRQTLHYMQRQGLVSGHYEHGLEITDKARKRLEKRSLDNLAILRPKQWDRKWRVIFYDIPEESKAARNIIAHRLRLLGCQLLQKSVWIHPFPCEEEVMAIAIDSRVDKYITYMEVAKLSNQEALADRFKHLTN